MSPFVKQRGVCSHTFHSIGLHGFAFSLSSSEIFGLILLVVALTATTNRTIFPVWDSVVRTVCFCSRCATSTQGITWSYSLTVWWHFVINIAYAVTLHEINNRQIGITHNIFACACLHFIGSQWSHDWSSLQTDMLCWATWPDYGLLPEGSNYYYYECYKCYFGWYSELAEQK